MPPVEQIRFHSRYLEKNKQLRNVSFLRAITFKRINSEQTTAAADSQPGLKRKQKGKGTIEDRDSSMRSPFDWRRYLFHAHCVVRMNVYKQILNGNHSDRRSIVRIGHYCRYVTALECTATIYDRAGFTIVIDHSRPRCTPTAPIIHVVQRRFDCSWPYP